jgi:hypothetical protein
MEWATAYGRRDLPLWAFAVSSALSRVCVTKARTLGSTASTRARIAREIDRRQLLRTDTRRSLAKG